MTKANRKRVLAVYPKSRDFGFAVFEGPTTLIEWGIKATRTEKEIQTLIKVAELIRHYRPEAILLEEAKDSWRCRRIKRLLKRLRALVAAKGLKCHSISSRRVRKSFLAFGASTKFEITHVIAEHLPELASWLPRFRKTWMSEDYWMAAFDAVALALAYFYSRPLRNRPVPTESPS